MALKTGLEGKPWYLGLSVGLGVGAVIAGALYWLYVKPLKVEHALQQARLEELQAKIQEGLAAQRELPKFREEVRQLELELDKLLRILPARRNTPDLMRRIRSLTEQGDFVLKKFNPKSLTDKEFFSEWPIEVNLDGSYHNLALFFDRISRFSRIINIEDLQIKARPVGAKGEEHTLMATFKAKTFVYKEPETEGEEGGDTPASRAAKPATEGPAALSGGSPGGPE